MRMIYFCPLITTFRNTWNYDILSYTCKCSSIRGNNFFKFPGPTESVLNPQAP